MFGAANIVEDQEQSWAPREDPIEVGAIGQALAKGDRRTKEGSVSGREFPGNVVGVYGNFDSLFAPPSTHDCVLQFVRAHKRVSCIAGARTATRKRKKLERS